MCTYILIYIYTLVCIVFLKVVSIYTSTEFGFEMPLKFIFTESCPILIMFGCNYITCIP